MEHNLQDRQTGLWARLRERAAAWNDPEARQQQGLQPKQSPELEA